MSCSVTSTQGRWLAHQFWEGPLILTRESPSKSPSQVPALIISASQEVFRLHGPLHHTQGWFAHRQPIATIVSDRAVSR